MAIERICRLACLCLLVGGGCSSFCSLADDCGRMKRGLFPQTASSAANSSLPRERTPVVQEKPDAPAGEGAGSKIQPVLLEQSVSDPGQAKSSPNPDGSSEKKADNSGALPAPKAMPGSGITLDQAINATLISDPKIRGGFEAINQANADALTSSLLPNPIYNGDAQLLPLTRPFTPTDQGGPPQTDHMIAYPIDWFLFGKRAAAMASAGAGVRVSEADYADLVRQRVRETALAFYDVLEAQGLLDMAQQDLTNLHQVEAALRKGFDLGGRAKVDLNRVRVEVLRSEQVLQEAQATVTTTKARLRAMMGMKDSDPAFQISGDLDRPLSLQPLPIEQSMNLAQENRPDIRSLRLQVDKAVKDVRVETTKAYPQVTPQFGYTRQFQQNTIGFPDASSWSTAVNISLPFFDRNQGNRAKAGSVLAQNALNLDAGLVDLRAEIVKVVQEFETAYKNAGTVAEEQVRLARDVRDSIEKAYRLGGRTLLEYLDAERSYRDTFRAYISNRASYWRSVYRFSAAIGKQVQPDERHAR